MHFYHFLPPQNSKKYRRYYRVHRDQPHCTTKYVNNISMRVMYTVYGIILNTYIILCTIIIEQVQPYVHGFDGSAVFSKYNK